MKPGKTEVLIHQWERLQGVFLTVLLRGQFARFGQKSRVMRPFRFRNLHRITVGARVMIERDCWIQTIEGHAGAEGPSLVIGDNVNIGMGSSISAALRIEIGEYALLGRNVYISDHGHAFRDIETPISRQGIDNLKPVRIGANSWLGQNVVILPGVSIGKNCVIGANSVVASSIPDHCVAVGSPARVVRCYNPETKTWEKTSEKPL